MQQPRYNRVPNPGGDGSGGSKLTSSERFVALLVLLVTAANFGMVLYLMLHRDEFLDNGDTVVSNSSRIEITEESGNTVVLSLADQHAFFGFANYTCEPNAPVQPLVTIPTGGSGILEETWYSILLHATLENTDDTLFSLQDNLYSVRVTEPGMYLVHSEVDVAVPINLTAPVTLCTFVDTETVGLFDVLRRTAQSCSSNVFNGNPDYGPMLITTTFDMFPITEPLEIQIRASVISDVTAQLGVFLSSLKVAKL